MRQTYAQNPTTEKLIRDGVIIISEKVEHRNIRDADGSIRQEVATTVTMKDPRQFVKQYKSGTDMFLKLFEGDTKAQTPFMLCIALEKSINLDYVHLTCKIIGELCKEVGIKVWSKSQVSKNISWLVENEIIYKSEEHGKYWINVELFYNGIFSRLSKGLD